MATAFDGLLVLDKPTGITSRAAVDRAQRWFPKGTRIGHTGTLDPLATGVLVLCVGGATRLAEYVQRMPKTYRAGITLGGTSDTDDADGIITPTPNAEAPTREKVDHELAALIGAVEQVPPAYSAAKVSGRRAYDLARKGKEVSLAARVVAIHRMDVVHYEYPRLEMIVHCGKGTYIRSLARDLGRRIGCGGYIHSLRRLEIGSFTAAEAVPLDADADSARARLLPSWRAIQDRPPLQLGAAEVAKLRQGGRVAHAAGSCDDLECFAVADDSQRMVAVVKPEGGFLRPIKVFGV